MKAQYMFRHEIVPCYNADNRRPLQLMKLSSQNVISDTYHKYLSFLIRIMYYNIKKMTLVRNKNATGVIRASFPT